MITFAEALAQTAGTRRHLLLGNGFSIALFPTCFTYGSLFQEANDKGLLAAYPPLADAFKALGSTDFELVMEALKAASKLAPLYGQDATLMVSHAEVLKGILVEAIAGNHPSRPSDITEGQYLSCRGFLAQFIGKERGKRAGKVFSLNYDLLMYWAVLHETLSFDWETGQEELVGPELSNDDGFRAPENNYDVAYVAWDQFSAGHSQCITYLHGALHLYERGPELAKLCWERSGNLPLMDQIQLSLDQDRYPLFVSEGTSDFKMTRINRSAYLSKALRSFQGCCDTKDAALFIIGHSLAASDDHILKRVKDGKFSRLYVSIFGDPESKDNMIIRSKAEALGYGRSDFYPLAVDFIDAANIHVWDA